MAIQNAIEVALHFYESQTNSLVNRIVVVIIIQKNKNWCTYFPPHTMIKSKQNSKIYESTRNRKIKLMALVE